MSRQPHCGFSLANRRASAVVPVGTAGRPGRLWGVVPALGDEVPAPAQQGCRLDEEMPETLVGEQSCQSGQHCSICRLQRWSVHLASSTAAS